jgi:hypothetical protein
LGNGCGRQFAVIRIPDSLHSNLAFALASF